MDRKFLAASKKKISHFFAHEFSKFGYSYEALNWESELSQYRRFEVLSTIGDMEGATLLDVGCGLGDLLKYLKIKKVRADYTGLDICPEMVEAARSQFQRDKNAKFIEGDLLALRNSPKYDYVVCSGAFNMNLGANDTMVREALARIYHLAEKAAAVSMLSAYDDNKDDYYYYYDPCEIFSYCKSICGRVTLRHDYMPHDFTVIMHRS